MRLPRRERPRIIDLLWHTPTGVIDRRATPTVAAAVPGTIATLEVRVLKHRAPPRGNNKAPYKVTCEDETGRIDLVFFHAERKFIERQLPEGSIRYVSGRIEAYNDKKQMAPPLHRPAPEARDDLPMRSRVSLTAGLSGKILLKREQGSIACPPCQRAEAAVAEGARLADIKTAVTRIHRPLGHFTRVSPGRRPGSVRLRCAGGHSPFPWCAALKSSPDPS